MTFTSVYLAILFDCLLGEPRRLHPLVGFGRIAQRIQSSFHKAKSPRAQFISGVLAWSIVVLPPVALLTTLPNNLLFESVVLYFCIAPRSLREHAEQVLKPLIHCDIVGARTALGQIVSRDTGELNKSDIRKGAIESVLENGSDGVFAPIFWFVVLGAPGALLYRLSNTLDAMWGYKTTQWQHFGCFAARIDDVLNWLPARLVALSYALLGKRSLAFQAWREQAHLCASPNAGPVMTAGAGALSITLGGEARYHGKTVHKPEIGYGPAPENNDVERAMALVQKTLMLWCCLLAVAEGLFYAY